MASAIDPTVIGAGNIDKASVRLQLERARDEITALENTRLLKAGDTMTGNLIISKADPTIALNKATAAQTSYLVSQQGGISRWGLNLAGATASDFGIDRYNDSGVFVDTSLGISRATGAPTFANSTLWRTALGAAPLPSTSGIGQWIGITTDGSGNYTLPAGGTWAYFWSNILATVSISPGGTQIITGDQPTISRGFAWRIA